MATQHGVYVELPPDLYERLQQVARHNKRSIESVLLDTARVMYGTLSADDEPALETYSDEQLWAVVYQRLAEPEGRRMRELVERGKQTGLPPDEEAELNKLTEKVNDHLLLRTRALVLLKQRGYDIEHLFNLGT
jgi:hypothetical protein